MTQIPVVEQIGFPFNSTGFMMNAVAPTPIIAPSSYASMDKWEDEDVTDDSEEVEKIQVEADPDLADESDNSNDGGVSDNDRDDEFEQYLFDEDDE